MLFTLLIWALAFMVLFSNKNNEINRWLAGSIFFISLGTFKEYLYYDLWPILPEAVHAIIPEAVALAGYSIMTACLYAFVSPLFMCSTLYLTETTKSNANLMKYIKILLFVPGIILLIIYPPMEFDAFQHGGKTFWYTFTAYNISYSVLVTFLLIKAILSEKDPDKRRQKRFVVIVVLPPLWFCMITIFVVHTLWIEPLLKLWKANVAIVAIAVVLYIFLAFREGIMGMKLRNEVYHWDTDMKTVNKGARYTSHILKNEITKIEWSASNLEKKYAEDFPKELAIIHRSTEHLKQFVDKTQLYSNDIRLAFGCHNVRNLIELSILSTREYIGKQVSFLLECPEHSELVCDKEHVIEVLNNLLMNGADAMKKQGTICITFERDEKKRLCRLVVTDEGVGIDDSDKLKLFEPYFTTKKTNVHFGMGLAYSANVMRKHGGYIEVQSEPGKGSSLLLYFPIKNGGSNGKK